MRIIDDVFATRKDPDQLQVTPGQQKKLLAIHPATLSEYSNDDGPLIWALMIPTTRPVMEEFIQKRISEKQLLDSTSPGEEYDCIYLCSVTTLPEARGQGLTKQLCLDAINAIRTQHPIKTLFAWPFTTGGEKLARSLSNATGLGLQLVAREHI